MTKTKNPEYEEAVARIKTDVKRGLITPTEAFNGLQVAAHKFLGSAHTESQADPGFESAQPELVDDTHPRDEATSPESEPEPEQQPKRRVLRRGKK